MSTEKDWKLFNNKLPQWQESFIEKKINEYIKLLNENMLASEKFWKLDKIMKEDKHHPGILIRDRISRSNYSLIVANLVGLKVINLSDLEEFSEDFIEEIKRFTDLK